jgi:hypothetical protein
MSVTDANGDAAMAVSDEQPPYRPEASVAVLRKRIYESLNDLVSEGFRQASGYMYSARWESDLQARHDLLVDASECVEIALQYLDTLKSMAFGDMNTTGRDEQF